MDLKQPAWRSKHCLGDCELEQYVKEGPAYAWLLEDSVKFSEPIDVGLKFQTFRILPDMFAQIDLRCRPVPIVNMTVVDRAAGLIHVDASLFAC